MDINLPEGFRLVRRLGEGGQAYVVLAEDLRERTSVTDPPDLVAIKCYSRAFLAEERRQKRVKREIRNLRLLDHPHIIGFRDVLLSDTHLCLVLNYASGGALFDVLCGKERLDEKLARWFFQQLILAVDYTHARGITNRDVKPENILLQPLPEGRPPFVLLCDFGLSRFEESGLISRMEGTFGYVAPEQYLGQVRNVEQAKCSEVYSCGVCLFQMLFGLTRWPAGPSGEAFKKPGQDFFKTISTWLNSEPKKIELPQTRRLSDGCVAFLNKLLQPNPKNRIAMKEIWNDPWFKEELPPNAENLNAELLARQEERNASNGRHSDKDIDDLIKQGAKKKGTKLSFFSSLLGYCSMCWRNFTLVWFSCCGQSEERQS